MNQKRDESLTSEEQLILQHMGSIVSQAKRFRETSITDIDDFKQEGCIALLKAIRKYNPEKGKLNTYAWPAILRAIHRVSKKFNRKAKDGQSIETPLEFDPVQKENIGPISELLPSLDEEETKLIMLRAFGYTLDEIGEIFGKHKQSVRLQLEKIYKKIEKAND
jgi:RNA polymerase sigma factor (sigma-70 family)